MSMGLTDVERNGIRMQIMSESSGHGWRCNFCNASIEGSGIKRTIKVSNVGRWPQFILGPCASCIQTLYDLQVEGELSNP